MEKSNITIYTDGSCLNNPGPGGWSFIIEHHASLSTIEKSGSEPATTNNRMELTGLIKAFEQLNKPCNVTVCSDSQYVLKGILEWLPNWVKNNWVCGKDKHPVKNKDLWEKIYDFTKIHSITTDWVKGHNGHAENVKCDFLAQEAARSLK